MKNAVTRGELVQMEVFEYVLMALAGKAATVLDVISAKIRKRFSDLPMAEVRVIGG